MKVKELIAHLEANDPEKEIHCHLDFMVHAYPEDGFSVRLAPIQIIECDVDSDNFYFVITPATGDLIAQLIYFGHLTK